MLTLGGAGRGNAVQAASAPESSPIPHGSLVAGPTAVAAHEAPADPWPARIRARLETLRPLLTTAGPSAPMGTTLRDKAELQARLGRNGQLGVHVLDLRSGAHLFDAEGDRALNPASNHKLLTAIAALELLGPDYRFSTRVLLDGDDLVIVGEGDPSLQVDALARLALAVRDQLAQAGAPAVRRIVIDDGAFSPERFGPGYDAGGPGYSYMAPSGALSLQWNTVEITAVPSDGDVEVFVDPPSAHVRVESTAHLGRTTALTIETTGKGDDTVVTVAGTLARRAGVHTIRRRIADPGRFAASVFAAALGPAFTDLPIVRGGASAAALPLGEHRSAPLVEVLHSALKFSNNFTIEQLLRTLGRHSAGAPGDWDNGAAALRAFWHATGGTEDGIVFENASGYSRLGRISARGLTDLLAFSQRPESRSAGVLEALAVSGTDGTMRDRLHDVPGRVFAKTGTLAGASALSGIVVGDDGLPSLAFSVLVNGPVPGHVARTVQDYVVRRLVTPG